MLAPVRRGRGSTLMPHTGSFDQVRAALPLRAWSRRAIAGTARLRSVQPDRTKDRHSRSPESPPGGSQAGPRRRSNVAAAAHCTEGSAPPCSVSAVPVAGSAPASPDLLRRGPGDRGALGERLEPGGQPRPASPASPRPGAEVEIAERAGDRDACRCRPRRGSRPRPRAHRGRAGTSASGCRSTPPSAPPPGAKKSRSGSARRRP